MNELDPDEEAIFNGARQFAQSEKLGAYLDLACEGRPELRRRIERLLGVSAAADSFFNQGAVSLENLPAIASDEGLATTGLLVAEGAGDHIGRYKLLQKIGEGGMGVVYMADQEEPVRRRVALKIIKLGMDTGAVVARFEAERQALALMDHPNIARILDGGATDTGRPYFVMELVQGVPLTEYCDKNKLSVPARIRLFIQVCEAAQSAHQKGIIHRDLKPSNVMVTLHDGIPVPKVIDFGVAKATNQRLTDKTLFTNYGTMIGTPAYMSPEQAEMSGLDVDTRSDIYSLGVLLYELLTGTTPFPEQRLRSVGYGEMQRIIAQEEPERPSTRRTKTRTARIAEGHTERSAVKRPKSEIDPDLDWIVMKCLEKDRARRYETANGLALDLKRHLDNEPVIARPPTTAYRIQKAFRRHKLVSGAVIMVVAALVLGLGVATVAWRQTRTERDGAVKARGEAETARTAESSQRQRAEAEALRARQFQYASDMNLAHEALDEGNLFKALQLLDRHRPSATNSQPATDLRGWEWRYLLKQCEGGQLSILGTHSNGVSAVGFLPGGKIAFSAGRDNAVRLWDLESSRQVALFPHAAAVTGAACSPDGRWLATSTEIMTNPLILWDLVTHQAVQGILTNAWLRPNTLAFSPDSKLLAVFGLKSATPPGGVSILRLSDRKIIANLPAYHHWLAAWGVAFSPDGQTLAYAENEAGDIVLWNVRQQSVIRRLKGHAWYVTSLAFTPDGQSLVSGSADRSIKLWDVALGTERTTYTNYSLGHGLLDVSSVRLSSDGKLMATVASGSGQRITIQSVPGGQEIIRLQGHRNLVTDGAFSPDRHTYISGSLDGTVRLWGLTPAPKESDFRPFPSDVDEFLAGTSTAFSLSPDGRHLLTIFTNQTFSVWQLPSLRESPRHPLPVSHADTAALANGGQLAAFVAADGNVVFWHGDTGETNWFARPVTNMTGRAVFSTDGKRFALGGVWGVSVCEVPGGRTLFNFPNHQSGESAGNMSLAFSPDGHELMAGFFYGLVKAWDFSQGAQESLLRGHDFQVAGLVLLPDGQTVVSAAKDIRFWDPNTQTARLILSPRPCSYRCLAISRDGRRLAAGANDGLITIWDLASQQEVATLTGHQRMLSAVSFLPDGNTLVSIGSDQIRVWHADTLQEADARSDSRGLGKVNSTPNE